MVEDLLLILNLLICWRICWEQLRVVLICIRILKRSLSGCMEFTSVVFFVDSRNPDGFNRKVYRFLRLASRADFHHVKKLDFAFSHALHSGEDGFVFAA